MTVVDRIRRELESMTRSERCVADFALKHINDIAFMTLAEMAEQTDVSTTSVLRFCRRLEFDGFKPFQQAVRWELKYSPELPDKFRRTADGAVEDDLLVKTMEHGISCIRQTVRELPPGAMTEAVARIAGARRVYIFGMRESQALADYAYSRLLTVRGDVFLYRDGYAGNVESLLSVGSEDVFLVYLFRRYTRQTLHLLELLQQRGAQVVLITSPPVEPVARFATVLLPCVVDGVGIKNSALAPVCLADYLCNAVALQCGNDALQRLRFTEELFRRSDTFEY